jgi:Metallo-peptidase family M12
MFGIRGLICMAVLAGMPAAATAQSLTLTSDLREQQQVAPALRDQVAELAERRGVRSVRVALVSAPVIQSAATGETLNIQLTPSRIVAAIALSLNPGSNGRVIWNGEIAGTNGMPPGVATLVINGTDITGSVRTPEGQLFRLRPLGNGQTAIIEMNYATMPRDHPPVDEANEIDGGDDNENNRGGGGSRFQPQQLLEPQRLPGQVSGPGAAQRVTQATRPGPQTVPRPSPQVEPERVERLERPHITTLAARHRDWSEVVGAMVVPTIDVLVAYTDNAEDAVGDIGAMIDLAIAETNTSFMNSGILARVRLVGMLNVNYNERNRDYYRMRSHLIGRGDIYLRRAHTRRDSTNADVVALIVDQDDYCGLAGDIGAIEEDAFVLVHWDCATGYYSFGHEIGHLLGARHDLDTDDTNTPYDFGHAYRHVRNTGGWRTIMGYRCSGNRCEPRLQYWSNPNVQFNNIDMGSTSENNRRVWNAEAERISRFR